MMKRRDFLLGALAAPAVATVGGGSTASRWDRAAYRKRAESRVVVSRAESYESPLVEHIVEGVRLCGLNVAGRSVLLKPNLVEFDPQGVINTNPAVVAAAIEAFRRLDAREVTVAEGPGHRRDNEYLLRASGLQSVLEEHRARYVDLNSDDVSPLSLPSRFTGFGSLYFPQTVLKTDLVVSMPKLKTHHWAGVTLSMKNMFGVIPGSIYGWPKNVLHWAGVDESIVDINSALSMPRFAIVDGIVGMEGNGPIQGTPKRAGVLIFGEDPVAVDATAARLMRLDPAKVKHLRAAGEFLGNIERKKIVQVGETIEALAQDFQVISAFEHLKDTG
jgi:uncharacterized protein (DUF362 family)